MWHSVSSRVNQSSADPNVLKGKTESADIRLLSVTDKHNLVADEWMNGQLSQIEEDSDILLSGCVKNNYTDWPKVNFDVWLQKN